MKVLITGGAGFIGSHVAEAHLKAGDDVTILDNFSTGRPENVPAGARLVELDIRDTGAAELIRSAQFDVVSHHAAQMDVRLSVSDPRFDASVNIDGLLNLLEAARAAELPRFVFVSSGGVVYGEPELRPTKETAPKAPLSPYGVSKLTGEHYLHYYHRVHGLDYVALRYSNVYGPRQDPGGEAGVVAIFSTRLQMGAPLTIYGDGNQTRDYIDVHSVVSANLLLARTQLPGSESLDDRAFNVGTGRETSVNELADLLGEASGRRPEIMYAEARPGELSHSSLDTTRLRRLGWEADSDMRNTLKKTYDWICADRGP